MSERVKIEPYEHTTSVAVCMGDYWDTVYLGGDGTARRIYDTLTRWKSAIEAAARAELGRCRSVLRDIEWTPDLDGDSYCPSCGRYRRRDHTKDCALAAALKGADHV